MPFTASELATASKYSLQNFIRNKPPVDNVNTERVFLSRLRQRAAPFVGGVQNVVEQIHMNNGANAQWFYGNQTVGYNSRDTIQQASFPWKSLHDGFYLDYDRLAQNGIMVDADGKPGSATEGEKVQLTNLLDEQNMSLEMGFDETLEAALLKGGAGAEEVVGLDFLVSTTPTTGTVGGIDRSVTANAWWRNNAYTGLTTTTTTGTVLDGFESALRDCRKYGKAGMPDLILAGSAMIDGYRQHVLKTYGQMNYKGGDAFGKVDGGVGHDGLAFNGIPMVYCPLFDDASFGGTWTKRAYMLNLKTIKYRPMKGQDKVVHNPARPHDQYVVNVGMTTKCTMTINNARANAVLVLA
jgi:hypothetical protein